MNREGLTILLWTLAISVGMMLVFVFLTYNLGWPYWILAFPGLVCFTSILFVVWFFRKPNRKRIADPDVVFSAADGKVVVIEEVFEKEFFNDKRIQVSVFMSLFNVHMNWFPVGGAVVYRKDHPGEYMVAWHPKSSEENERTTTVVDNGKVKILFRQIAGLVARRIVNYAEEGTTVEQNTKCGFIKFGSRVDIFLPPGSEVLVSLGDKVTGSRTPLARLK